MSKDPNDEFTLLVDVKTKKVGCVILQSAFGVNYDRELIHLFDDWETNITPDLAKVKGTRAQWESLAERSNKK